MIRQDRNEQEAEEALNADAITEILLRLPAKSVCRFRCVSKRWLSLVSDPRFIRAHAAAAPAEPSGFYLYDEFLRETEFFPLNGGGRRCRDPTLSFLDFRGVPPQPVDSCNGLLLCRLSEWFGSGSDPLVFSVCNPTTREHAAIPFPNGVDPYDVYLHLAFDPRRSPHYSVLAAVDGRECRLMYKYTSETRSWKLLPDCIVGCWPFARRHTVVYWNGSLVSTDNSSAFLVALDMESERTREILLPRRPMMYTFFHLGVSGDRLHYIRGESYLRFEILEMASVSSGWRVLHSLDLDPFRYHCLRYPVAVVEFIRGDGDRLLIQMLGEIVSFHLPQKTFTTICHFPLPLSGDTSFLLSHTLSPLICNRIDEPPSHEWVSWKSEHDQLLISLMVEQSRNGKKIKNGFQIDAWREMVRMFNQATGMNYDVLHLENRLKSYEREYQAVNNLLAIDGFHWAPCEMVVDASYTDWSKILKRDPRALVYKRKQVPFEDLKIICASSICTDNKVSQNTGAINVNADMISID